MDFFLPFSVKEPGTRMQHAQKVMLIGSCFTEHIGLKMLQGKMTVMQNPQGILFNPASIAHCLEVCLQGRTYTTADLFFLQDTWQHWDFHSRFAHTDAEQAITQMNSSIAEAHTYLLNADWLILSLGSSYQYFTSENAGAAPYGVANCHKAPGSWFRKELLTTDHMLKVLSEQLEQLSRIHPGIKVILTVSPVRHVRDGLAENNRSKSRLLELVHTLTEWLPFCHYFPAYELMIDVLRDYRFYEQDMIHPGSQAVQYIWERFIDTYMEGADKHVLQKVEEIQRALAHRFRFPASEAAHKFRQTLSERMEDMERGFPYIDWSKERLNLQG